MKLKAILATAAAMSSMAQGKTSIQQVASKKDTVKTIDTILGQVDNYVAHLTGIKDKIIEAIEYKEEKGPLMVVTFQNEVLYGNLMKDEFESKAAEGMVYAVYGQNGRIWGINVEGQICYLDTKEEGSDWVIFHKWKGWRSIAPYGNAILAPFGEGISYFPNVEAPGIYRNIGGILDTLSWDGSHMCGAGLDHGSCWCRPFDGDYDGEYDNSAWMMITGTGVVDCVPNGDRVIAFKEADGYIRTQASPIQAGSSEWEDISGPGFNGTYTGALVGDGKFVAGVGASSMVYYDEQNSDGKFGIPTRGRQVEGYLKLAVTDQQLLALNANKIVTAPLQEGPLVALSIDGKDVLYGNLKTNKFRNGGSFASKFAAFGPKGILWGVDQSGNIGFLDTKVKEPWLKSNHFASGNYTRVTAHKEGLVALDIFGAIKYFPDVKNPSEYVKLSGTLNTVTWDGTHLCGVNQFLKCYCAPFDGSQNVSGAPAWVHLSTQTLDCFPHGAKGVLLHKKNTLRLYSRPYSSDGHRKPVTPEGKMGQYKHLAVSGSYLAGTNANGMLRYVEESDGKFGVAANIRSVSGYTSIAVYDPTTEDY